MRNSRVGSVQIDGLSPRLHVFDDLDALFVRYLNVGYAKGCAGHTDDLLDPFVLHVDDRSGFQPQKVAEEVKGVFRGCSR